MIAVGTVANAIDDSFETTADLEIMSVDFAPGSGKEMAVKGKVDRGCRSQDFVLLTG